MALTVGEIAAHLAAEYRGDGARLIDSVAPIHAAAPNTITFVSHPRFRRHLADTGAGVVLVTAEMSDHCPVAAIVVNDPYLAYAQIAQLLHPRKRPPGGVHASAVLAEDVRLGRDVAVGPHAVLETGVVVGAGTTVSAGCFVGAESRLGSDCLLQPNVTVHDSCRLGDRVVVQAGSVIGGDGFGFASDAAGHWVKIPHLGGVRIGDDCEIGAATTIDRGALEDTVLEHGVILDNQIQVAHNVHIGAHTAIAGCVGIAGSASIGRFCRIGGGVGILGHLQIVDHVHIAAMSLVTKSITEPGSYASGSPLEPSASWRKNHARIKQLDALARRMKNIEKRVDLDD